MTDIFVSYQHNDRPRAEVLAQALEASGLTVWWDRTIPAGQNFDQVIEKALNETRLVIVLWSHESVASRWVRNEAEEAAGRNILVPVLVEADVRIPLAFKRIQAANLVDWTGATDAPEFTELIADLMQRLSPAPAPESGPASQSSAPPAPRVADPPPVEETVGNLPPVRPTPRPLPPSFLQRRSGLTALLGGVFLLNYIETSVEVALDRRFGLGSELGLRIAGAFSALEGNLSFESHDLSNWLAVYGYSTAYFFLLPVLGLGLGLALWRHRDVQGYRLLCLAITIDYLLSVSFFVFFPVPERWAYPDSGAMLLSDRWSSTLIDLLRPISALDNCFPSTHVSFTVVIVLVAYFCQVRLRHTMCALGMTVVLSTFVLGIHWIPDIVAGVAVGVLSVGMARRLTSFSMTAMHTIVATAAS